MNEIFKIESISQLNSLLGFSTQHPLIALVDFSHAKPELINHQISFDFYAVMKKDTYCGELLYGRQYYDYQDGTLVFIAPHQIISIDKTVEDIEPSGWGLFFHPDLLRGVALGNRMHEFTFFNYEAKEALHVSEIEMKMLEEILLKVKEELAHPIDKHSKLLIASNIELFLSYCNRYYDRQFYTRDTVNSDLLSRFERLLRDYYHNGTDTQKGMPTVKYCADQLSLSPSYMSDLLKKMTGFSAQEHIQRYVLEESKILLVQTNLSVSEIAYSLGFEYPQYFSRLFKKKVGVTPVQFRNQS